ncbi:hypothetical protein Tco_0333667, partial [Tanacetum coccineum]
MNVMHSTLMLIRVPLHRPCSWQTSHLKIQYYDEVGPSYDSNNPFEVQDHDTFVDHMDDIIWMSIMKYTRCKTMYNTTTLLTLMLTVGTYSSSSIPADYVNVPAGRSSSIP